MDAVAAACLACAVIEPQACDLGGYVAAGVVLEGKTGRIWSLDANSVAPAAAHEPADRRGQRVLIPSAACGLAVFPAKPQAATPLDLRHSMPL